MLQTACGRFATMTMHTFALQVTTTAFCSTAIYCVNVIATDVHASRLVLYAGAHAATEILSVDELSEWLEQRALAAATASGDSSAIATGTW